MATKLPYKASDRVEHSRFGHGSVVACTEDHITIKFDEKGERKFVLSIALPNIRKSDQPSPEKKKATKKKAAAPAPAEA